MYNSGFAATHAPSAATSVARLREEVEMARGLCPPFDLDAFRAAIRDSIVSSFGYAPAR